MRLTPTLKYQLTSTKWPIIIYYIVIYALMITMGISRSFDTTNFSVTFGGLDGASIIFLFVVGLNAFKSNFHMFVANGVSRKTMFTSFIASTGILCAGMALVDSINVLIISQFVEYQPAVMQLFDARYIDSGLRMYTESFLWMFFSYVSSIMLGYFITTAYYRMNKPLKLAVSIGVPVMVFIVLPILDNVLFDHQLTVAFRAYTAFCSGQSTGSPYVAMLFDVINIAVTGALAYLLARRATVKLQTA